MGTEELTPEQKAKATLVRHGRPDGLVESLTREEVEQLAAIEGNSFELFDAFWGAFRKRLEDSKATVEGADEAIEGDEETPEPETPEPQPE